MRRKRWSASVIGTRLILLGLALGFVLVFPTDTPSGNSLNERVLGDARDVLFNYVAWEINAIGGKLEQQQSGFAPYMTETRRAQYVDAYLTNVRQADSLDAQISAIYSDPSVSNPDDTSAALRARRDAKRQQVAQQQPLAEAIMEEQVSSVLRDEGFSTFGAVLPPVSAHITELPRMLVISPRDKIQLKAAIIIDHLSDDAADKLERAIDSNLRDLNISSLVVPLGGLSLYPSMVDETWNASFAFELIAHEWTHHYLYFFPLGLAYNDASDTRTINETTASLNGKEIARKVIERYYMGIPDIKAQLPPPITPTPPGATPTPNIRPTATPPTFDFAAAMNETRVNVDRLLAAGKIDEAEQYMETRRRLFVANRYGIRKLNQAYFAFYGGYQSPGDTGAGGSDPIGPSISEIRQRSPSEKAWLETMRSITSTDQLLAVRDALRKAT